MIKEDLVTKKGMSGGTRQLYAHPITNSQTVMLKYEAIYEGELTRRQCDATIHSSENGLSFLASQMTIG